MQQELRWWKSSYSGQNGGDCIECAVSPSTSAVASTQDVVFVRDSKEPHGANLHFPKASWNSFITAAATNTFAPVAE
ncbi:DUF397 domain-containing protein [Streptomyces sp. NPDC102441]|uniref:DUF397 domain-containing protein n=1 Tax=Streptomyces sp. NPDC102441 TaxID=3366176 RepID=UPI0037F76D42